MKKIIIFAVFTFSLVLAGSASAASISNIRFDNNQTQKSVAPGESVNVTFRVTVLANEVVELGEVDVLGDSLAPALPTSLGGELGLPEGQHDVQMTVTAPQNTGYYTVSFKTAGIYGGQRAVVMTDGVVSSASFGNAIRVVDSNSNSGSGGSSAPSWFTQMQDTIAALAKQLADLTKVVLDPPIGTPAPLSEKCSQLQNASMGTYYGSYNAAPLQNYLIANGFNIPAGPTGYFGNQTQNALSNFKMVYKCS